MNHKQYGPKTTIIAFDLHGVVVTCNYREMVLHALRNPLSVGKLALYSCNPFFLRDIYRLWRSHAVAAAYLQLLADRYPFLQSTIPFFIAVGNAQKPNIPLIRYIKTLKEHGYSVQLFSNIGDIIFDDFRKKHPDIIDLFDTRCITHKTKGYVGKPYDSAFAAYQVNCNPEKKRIIFIDNTKRNITAARRHHMIGVYYTTPDRLIKQLSDLLIL